MYYFPLQQLFKYINASFLFSQIDKEVLQGTRRTSGCEVH